MALIVCGDCKTQVSDQAEACPQCGAPVVAPRPPPVVATAPPKVSDGMLGWGVLIGAAVVFILFERACN